jgi:hypothetical protein
LTSIKERNMNEYNVTFVSIEQGGILVDVHRSSGTSRYAKFKSVRDVRAFFLSLGLNEEKVAEMEAICSKLRGGETYHESMVFPESVLDAMQKLCADTDNCSESTQSDAARSPELQRA